MPRARNIKPGFFKNEELVEARFESRLLFAGLWTLADREGRIEDRPKRIKMEIFPADAVDVDQCLDELHDLGLIVRYSVGDGKYIEIPKFSKHQNPHHREPASEIPPRESTAETGEPEASPRQALGKHEASPSTAVLIPDSLLLIPDSCSPNSGADKPRKFVAAHVDLPDEINPDAWREWCEFRSAKRKPVSEAAARKQIKLLCRYPKPVQQDIVDTSIQNDYQGLFEPKGDSHENTRQPDGTRQDTRRLSPAERIRAARREAGQRHARPT